MIGICTKYRKTDSTLAAIAIADRLERNGRCYKLNYYDWKAKTIDKYYDNKATSIPFDEFVAKTTHIIWTSVPTSYFLEYAIHNGVKNTLYTSIDDIDPFEDNALDLFNTIIVPTQSQARCLKDSFRIRTVLVMPYDCNLPIIRHYHNNTNQLKLFISFYGNQLRRVDLAALILLANVVEKYKHLSITIACNKGLAKYTTNELKKYKKLLNNRWNILDKCNWSQQVIQMGKHDLTVWPTKWDGFGIIGTTSLCLGIPVIAFNISPINEILNENRNSLLINTKFENDWLGMPHATPNYEVFEEQLCSLIESPNKLNELKQHTADGIADKQKQFEKTLDNLLPMF